MDLNLALEEKQILSQRMLQSVTILQMNAMELDGFIKEMSMENPVIELEDAPAAPEPESTLRQKLEWLETMDEQNRVYYREEHEEDDSREAWNILCETGDSLQQYVLSQLIPISQNEEEERIFHYLAYSLDSHGYLADMPHNLVQAFQLQPEQAADYLRRFQSVDPAGVGATDLKECLLLQLQRLDKDDWLSQTIIHQHLELLGKNQLSKIAAFTGAELGEVEAACRRIKALNPRPSNGFSSRENLKYIQPDVTVVKFTDYFEVLLNDPAYSGFQINSYYLRMLKEQDDPEIQKYLGEKVRQAKWIQSCIWQRGETLLAVTRALVECQSDFFEHEEGALRPLRLLDIAQKLGVHESTVSRAVRDKYLQCSRGIYPLNYFFTHKVGSGNAEICTQAQIKKEIQELIQSENKGKPYSDQKLADLLNAKGITIARRTVAKYRIELGVADANGRKQYS